jgi:Raf kinase inhibitor-like YbhB/YbcL family protein
VRLFCLVTLLTATLSGCGTAAPPSAEGTPIGDFAPGIPLTSGVFVNHQPIPQKYACNGDNISPPLHWGDTLPDVKSFALVMDDPDAPNTYIHWVVYSIPQITHSLPEAVPADTEIAGGGKQGANGSGKSAYAGPCPPSGTHHYFFKLYALDIMLDLPAGTTKSQLEQAMKGHILAYGELVGLYSK